MKMKPPRKEKRRKKEEKEEQMKKENREESQPNKEQQEITEGIDSEENAHQPDTLERLLEKWMDEQENEPGVNNTGNR